MYNQTYYQNNKKKFAQWLKEYRSKNRDKEKKWSARYRSKYRDRYIERTKRWRAKLRDSLFDILGKSCIKCGSTIDLQFDHIKEDGKTDRSRFKAATSLYVYYRNHPDEARRNLQVLCGAHNIEKATTAGKYKKVEGSHRSLETRMKISKALKGQHYKTKKGDNIKIEGPYL